MSHLPFHRDELIRLLAEAGDFQPEVAERLRWFLYYVECGSVSKTCRAFNIARSTFYRWATRFHPQDLHALEDAPTVQHKEPTAHYRNESQEHDHCSLCAFKDWYWLHIARPLLIISIIVNLTLLSLLVTVLVRGNESRTQVIVDPETFKAQLVLEPESDE